MKYRLIIKDLADKHFQNLQKSGDKASLKKLLNILDELEIHPKIGTVNP